MINTSDIEKAVRRYFSNYNYKLFNLFIYSWESDFFAISTSGYTIEVEIKVSKSDFKADYKKTTSKGINKHKFLLSDTIYKPNKFYFACPRGLILPNEIDKKYGLLYLGEFNSLFEVQKATFLHKDKFLDNKQYLKTLLDKYYWQNMRLKDRMNIYDPELNYGQKLINF